MAFLSGLLITTPLGLFLTLLLLNPHSDTLPILQLLGTLILLFIVLGIPIWLLWLTFEYFSMENN